MIAIHKRFEYSAAWNLLESVGYQILLFTHQCALYKILSAPEYGIIGTIFSLVYLGIAVCNFGLDSSISPFFLHATHSKKNAWKSILLPAIVQFGILSIIMIVALLALHFWVPIFLPAIPFSVSIFLGIVFISEALKKTVRTILHCAFKNHLTTTIELATIISYIGSIWLLYMFGYKFNLFTLFMPMATTSLISLILLCFVARSWYKELPNTEHTPLPINRILYHRAYAYGTQLSTIFFSSNFLVPLFAWQFGVEYAAILKLMSYFSYLIHTVIHKVFGGSLQACFAAIKEEDIAIKQRFFVTMTSRLYQLMYGIGIFCAINYQRIVVLKHISLDQSTAIVGYLFLAATLIENFLVSYEQLYQAEEKTGYLSLFNIINITLLGLFCITRFVQDPITFLALFIVLRMSTIAGIAFGAFYLWRITPDIKPKLRPIFCFIAFSLFFFLVTI